MKQNVERTYLDILYICQLIKKLPLDQWLNEFESELFADAQHDLLTLQRKRAIYRLAKKMTRVKEEIETMKKEDRTCGLL